MKLNNAYTKAVKNTSIRWSNKCCDFSNSQKVTTAEIKIIAKSVSIRHQYGSACLLKYHLNIFSK